jgi:hypothetical protein
MDSCLFTYKTKAKTDRMRAKVKVKYKVPFDLAYFRFFYSIKGEVSQTDFQKALDRKKVA